MSAKSVVRVAWCEAHEHKRLADQLRQANQQALARLVRDLVAKAAPAPRRKRGRKPVGPPPLSEAECMRLHRTYRLGAYDPARCHACAVEITTLLNLGPEKTKFVLHGLRYRIVGKRSRALYWWWANIRDLRISE